jgi:hypothetical protein
MRIFYLLFILFILSGCKKEFLSSDKGLLDFTIESKNNPALSSDLHCVIKNDTLLFILPSDTMSKKLIPTIAISAGAKVVPGNLEQKDFTHPVLYTVAAANGTIKNYIIICQPKTSLKSLVSFKLEKNSNSQLPVDVYSPIINDTIKIRLPEGTSPRLLPVITVNDKASIVETVVSTDFSGPVYYTIRAEDGSTKKVVTTLTYVAPPKLKNFTINNAECAYIKSTDTYLYPAPGINTLNNYLIKFDTTASRFVKLDEFDVKNNKTANYPLKANKQLQIVAYDEFGRSVNYKLLITGMPIVQINAGSPIGDNEVNASFILTDPNNLAHNGPVYLKSNIAIKVRGATSRFYPKNQYAIDMMDDNFVKTDKSLMGLRNDEDWILDAMYVDPGRMRNRLCTDIWNSMNNVPQIAKEPDALNGTRGYMVEVILNNEYQGVFCLTEKMDRKQAKIKKNGGLMYKADFLDNATSYSTAPAYDNNVAAWGGWSFEYPDLGNSPAPDWKPLYNFVNYVITSSDDDFTNNVGTKLDIDNAVDYLIFINATAATDNISKNIFFSYYNKSTDPKFFFTAWDLDATFGRTWNGDVFKVNPSEFDFFGPTVNALFAKLLNDNPNNFKQKLKARWDTLKSNQLSKNTINNRIDEFRKILIQTNAGAREREKWATAAPDFDMEASYMTNWYNSHYDWLNDYINNL